MFPIPCRPGGGEVCCGPLNRASPKFWLAARCREGVGGGGGCSPGGVVFDGGIVAGGTSSGVGCPAVMPVERASVRRGGCPLGRSAPEGGARLVVGDSGNTTIAEQRVDRRDMVSQAVARRVEPRAGHRRHPRRTTHRPQARIRGPQPLQPTAEGHPWPSRSSGTAHAHPHTKYPLRLGTWHDCGARPSRPGRRIRRRPASEGTGRARRRRGWRRAAPPGPRGRRRHRGSPR